MLTIFDCDGVLIDSEIIASEVIAAALLGEGCEMSAAEVTERFIGLSDEDFADAMADAIGHSASRDMREGIDAEISRRLETVRAVPGISAMLDHLDGPRCVCSNSGSDYLRNTLTTAGLYDRFKPYVFAAREVGTKRGKPDPNVFLFAASEFGVTPRDIVVVEDSIPGMRAAVAAGMRTVGFIGGAHAWRGLGDALTEAGAETVVRRASDLVPTIEALVSWAGLD
jgi:HAD superfamily hydrolase (TIGR01509 family)